MSESVYTPSKWGAEFHALKVDEALGAGSAGVGKTVCLRMDALDQIIVEHQRCTDRNHPYYFEPGKSRAHILFLRREWEELGQVINLTMNEFPAIDPGADYKATTHTWTFSSGLKYQFGHCKDADDHTRYLGSAYTKLLYDELATFSLEQYEAINARLRSADPVLGQMLMVRAMSNPGSSPGSDSQWVRKRFVDPAPLGKKVIREKFRMKSSGKEFYKTRIYWPGKLTDNPNPEFAERYEQNLIGKASHIVKAYLDGDWYFTQGSFFGEDFDPRLHVINVFKPPSDWPVFRSMDWGFKSTGVIGWYAMDPEENLYKFYEYKFTGRLADVVAEDVKRIEKKLGYLDLNGKSRLTGPADTQIWEERGDTAKRKIDLFVERGVNWVQADKKSRAANAERLIKRLRDHNCGTRAPGIMFMSNCKYTISSLPQIQTDPDCVEEPLKGGDDHAADETMYACAYASHGSSRIYVAKDERDEFEDDADDAKSDFGQWGYGSRV